MNRQIRRLGLVFGVLLFALLINLSFQQVFLADSIKSRSGNSRTLLQEYDRERGPILVEASQVAKSISTDDTLKYLRVYSNGPLYASATGFYSMVYGATGIEKAENPVLSGTGPEFFVDRLGQLFGGQDVKGGAVTLTLNPQAQEAAFQGLDGKVGSVTAIDPKTGAILALAQSPSFDPNKLSSHDAKSITAYYQELEAEPDKPLLNRPLVSTPPPGSTFKLVTAAAALESGRYNRDSELPGPAVYPLPNSQSSIPNWFGGPCGPNDKTTLQAAMVVSCNTAFAYLGNELGNEALKAQAERFGFNTSFQVPLVAATSRYPGNLDAAQTAQSAIGQFNVTATSLQMALVGAAIGNGGVAMEPFLVQDTRGSDTQLLSTTEPREHARALSSANAGELLLMMEAVVNQGTGGNAAIPGIRVGGKTGTAETGGTRPNVAWFVAVAPIDDPQVAVAVTVENANTTEVSGNQLAAPIARQVIEALLQ
jgi:peptidoglycan glycosyltransferase